MMKAFANMPAGRRGPRWSGWVVLWSAAAVMAATQGVWATVYVDKDATEEETGESWSSAFRTIQAGIDAAMGDEVWVAEGAYQEADTLTTGVAVLGGFAGGEAQLSDRDVRAHVTTIDGTGHPHVVRLDGCVNARLDGFTISGGNANGAAPDNGGGGVYCKNANASNTIANCTITGNQASSQGGGLMSDNSSVDVRNCSFVGNVSTSGGGAVRAQNGGAATFTNCVFRANQGTQGGAAFLGARTVTLTNCTFADNEATTGQGALRIGSGANSASITNCLFLGNSGCAVVEKMSANPAIESCLFHGNPDGDYSYNDVIQTGAAAVDAQPGTNHILEGDPLVANLGSGDLHLLAGSPCIDAGADVSPLAEDIEGTARPLDGNGDFVAAYDIGAYEYQSGIVPTVSVVYVSQAAPSGPPDGAAWDTAFATIPEGIAAANSGDQVWVAAGVYTQRISLKNGVQVYGGFAGDEEALDERDFGQHVTTIDVAPSNGGRAVLMVNVSGAAIDGFTIQGGHAYGNTGNEMLNYGGGVFCSRAGATNRIANCTVAGNFASISGGGVYCFNGASPAIENCIIRENIAEVSGGGLYCGDHSSPAVSSSTIEGNSAAYGAGVYLNLYSSPALLHCRIADNAASQRGGGIYCSLNCSPDVTNCVVRGNSATGGSGGAVYCMYGSSPAITNSTIADNSAVTGGGVFVTAWHRWNDLIWGGSGPSIVNTILARNSQKAIYEFDPLSDPSVTYSLFHGNADGDYFDDDTGASYTGAAAITANVPGTSHIGDGNPRFVNASGGNYRLAAGSAAINAGNNAAPKMPSTDLDGKPRVNDGTVDLGAFEYYETPSTGAAHWQEY